MSLITIFAITFLVCGAISFISYSALVGTMDMHAEVLHAVLSVTFGIFFGTSLTSLVLLLFAAITRV